MIDPKDLPARTANIAIVAVLLAPYRITLLNRLGTLAGLRVTAVLSESDWRFQNQSVGLEEARFPYRVFKRYKFDYHNPRADRTSLGISPKSLLHLLREGYDVVVGFGWTSPDTVLALLIAKWRRLPVVLWDTSIPHPPGRLKQFLMPLVRRMIAAYDGYFVPSTPAAEYFISMGASAADMTLIPQVIDNAAFARAAEREGTQRAEHKAALGITTPQVILFVGQLTARKGLDVLLDAFHRVSARNPAVSLLLVGEGPMQPGLTARAHTLGLEQRVFFSGYVPRAALPRFYTLSDVFVLPSWYDTFGVVVLEAMACGLPVITTSSVGAARDLIRQGENGFVVEYGDAAGLASALEQVFSSETRRAAMGDTSRKIIAGWNLDLAAKNFEQAIWALLRKRAKNNDA